MSARSFSFDLRFLPFAVVFFLFLGSHFSQAQEELKSEQIYKKGRAAIVLLITYDQTDRAYGMGTGFFVSSDGKIITNRHVIEGATRIVAKTQHGDRYPIEGVLGINEKADVALIQAKAEKVPFLEVERSAFIPVGAKVTVIGNPLGDEGKISEGVVSSKGDWQEGKNLIITAPVSPGSSGSPVFNSRAEVVGVVVAKDLSPRSISFAIPGEIPRDLIARYEDSTPQALSDISWGEDYKVKLDMEYATALNALEQGKYQQAHDLLSSVAQRYPKNEEVLLQLGYASESLHLYDQCQQSYLKATEINSENPLAWYYLGRCYLRSRQIEKANDANEKVVHLEAGFYEAWVNLGIGYSLNRKVDEAVAAWQKATTINPDGLDAWRALGAAYHFEGHLDLAADAYQKAVVLKPDDKECWQELVAIYGKSGRVDRQLEAQHRVKELDVK